MASDDRTPLPFEKTLSATLLAIFLPGGGHYLLGRRFIGLVSFILITTVWATGFAMTDGACIHPRIHPYALYAQALGTPTYTVGVLQGRPRFNPEQLDRLVWRLQDEPNDPQLRLDVVGRLVRIGRFRDALKNARPLLSDEMPPDWQEAAKAALLWSPPLLLSRDEFESLPEETTRQRQIRLQAQQTNAEKVANIDAGLLFTMLAGLLNILLVANVLKRARYGGHPPPARHARPKDEEEEQEEQTGEDSDDTAEDPDPETEEATPSES